MVSPMDRLDVSEAPQTPSADLSNLSDLARRTLACRAEVATLFRAVQGIAGLAATNLETGGAIQDLCGLYSALDQLGRELGDQTERYGALLSSAGSA